MVCGKINKDESYYFEGKLDEITTDFLYISDGDCTNCRGNWKNVNDNVLNARNLTITKTLDNSIPENLFKS